MGRKKKKNLKPWCWYCNREFDDEKVLIGHQKAKHFKCHICHKKLYTAPGLAIHCSQVHKETITRVPNSILERSILDLEIYGMEGVPEDAKRMREIEKYGSATADEPPDLKRPKLETPQDPTFSATGMMAGVAPVLVPGMPPLMPGVVPPPGGVMGIPPANLTVPQRPLFPSAAVQAPIVPPAVNSSGQVSAEKDPTLFQSAGSTSSSDTTIANAPLITPLPENSLLMHPKEDLSMEEIRAARSKYATIVPSSLPGPPILRPGIAPGMIMNNSMLGGPVPAIRPGMGPPNMGMRPPEAPSL